MSLVVRQRLQRPGREGRTGFVLDVDLELPGSQVTVVFGRSGGGKTTLLRCLAGLERKVAGTVRCGDSVWQDDAKDLFLPPQRRAAGYVFQDGALFPHLDVAGNLDYALRRVPSARRRIGREEVVALLELEPLLSRRTDDLSGGERQRVALGRALLGSPDLLLLDEPLAALDRPARRAILPFLEMLARRFALPVLYVTHFLNEAARVGDHLVLLQDGRNAGEGPLARMLTEPDSPLTREQEAGALLIATVRERDDQFQLACLEIRGGRLFSPDPELNEGDEVRIRILARDVSLALEAAADSSILNVLPAQVIDLAERGPGRVLVRLDLGGDVLLAAVTGKSAAALDLGPGRRVFAQIKSVALL